MSPALAGGFLTTAPPGKPLQYVLKKVNNLNFKILFISGHYISDVYDIKKQAWFTYNDLEVSKIQEASVQSDRDRSGYIFFYMHK